MAGDRCEVWCECGSGGWGDPEVSGLVDGGQGAEVLAGAGLAGGR